MHITIPAPCTKNWDAMQPQDDGRFCTACSKVVVDFTQMSATEIATYFENKKIEDTCGRFTNLQLDTPGNAETEALIKNILNTNWAFFKKMAAVILLCFIIPLTSVAQIKKDSATNNNDTVVCTSLGTPIRKNPFLPKRRPLPKLQPTVITAPIALQPIKKEESVTGPGKKNKR
jgi:hypothetical protein